MYFNTLPEDNKQLLLVNTFVMLTNNYDHFTSLLNLMLIYVFYVFQYTAQWQKTAVIDQDICNTYQYKCTYTNKKCFLIKYDYSCVILRIIHQCVRQFVSEGRTGLSCKVLHFKNGINTVWKLCSMIQVCFFMVLSTEVK